MKREREGKIKLLKGKIYIKLKRITNIEKGFCDEFSLESFFSS